MKTELTSHQKALAAHLEVPAEEITQSKYHENEFECGGETYHVFTDLEADGAVEERIKDSIWAFNADFILHQCDLPLELTDCIRSFQGKECESANDALLALVEKCAGLDKFVRAAVSADGRGHFLSSYDGEENEVDFEGETYYIYRN